MFNVMGEPETPARYRSTTWVCYCIVLLLIAAAVAAPLYSMLGDWMATGEKRGIWIQRSGAVTTLFSFIAGAMVVFTSGRLHTPGFWGDSNRIPILIEFRGRFQFAEAAIFLLSIFGTVLWGYGDLIYAWLN
ncbi:hypothetical protein [Pseudomonas taiwanensis]|uniref:hypothetical protein n=1 Tax=Pseudomonas taiwanensis TaxID=470150 RepID=UPI0016494749|nr:hypothetical protein [Pseudomonas taiwanensis]MBC3493586.1 hypothetical protein [Pseudomonas taiwanensis]